MQRALASAVCVAALTTACASKQSATTPVRPAGPSATIVLLPDAPGNTVGRAVVANAAGSVELDTARAATTVSAGRPPATPRRMSEAEVDRRFGDALSALPPAASRFTLHFKFESDELTEQSRDLLPEVLKAVKSRAVPEVTVVGHTDTLGSAQANYALALRRARTVRALLINAGLTASLIEVASHGEREPLVQTSDDTAEPRNRRVDIAVR